VGDSDCPDKVLYEIFQLRKDASGSFNFIHFKDVQCAKPASEERDAATSYFDTPHVDNEANVYYAAFGGPEGENGGENADGEEKENGVNYFRVFRNDEEIVRDWADKFEILEERQKSAAELPD
jgi:hypothetical protein